MESGSVFRITAASRYETLSIAMTISGLLILAVS